jgi:hypothetical protein
MKAKWLVVAAAVVVSIGATSSVAGRQSITCSGSFSSPPQPDGGLMGDQVRFQSTTQCTAQTSLQTTSTLQYSSSSSGPWSTLDSQYNSCPVIAYCTALKDTRKPFGQCGYYYRTLGKHDWWSSDVGWSTIFTTSAVVFDYC